MALSKCPILESEPLCLRATGAGITEIDVLSPQQTDALSLYVSHNQISKLDKIIQFKSLERLLIEYNQITYLEDLYPLAELPKLKELRMDGNPVCRQPLFAMYALYLIPTLESLNGKKVNTIFKTEYTPEDFKKHILAENKILKLILMADMIIKQIKTSPNTKIRSVESEIKQQYSQENLIEEFGKFRSKGEELSIDKYYEYLKDLLIQKHQEISSLLNDAQIDDAKTRIHNENLQNLPKSENLDQLVKTLTELNDSACLIIEDERADGGDRKSITSFFSKKIGFNFDRAKSVSPKYGIQKSRNRDAQSTIAGSTDAQSILGYYLGDDENVDNKSMRSARSTRSSWRRQHILNKMKQGNYSPKGNRRKNKNGDTSSQASIDDVALNIEDGKITLIDPKHPEENIFPDMTAPDANEAEETKERSTTTENIEKDQNQNHKNHNNEEDQSNNKNEITSSLKESNDQTISEFPKPNKSSLSSKRDDKSKNPDKKVTLLLNNENDNRSKENNNKPEKKATVVTSPKTYPIVTNPSYLISYFTKWKQKYNLQKRKEETEQDSNMNSTLENISILYEKTKELDDEIEILQLHQKCLSDSEQLALIAEATKRRELLRNIENLRDIISQSTNRATQFQKEVNAKEKFFTSFVE